ncbi:MAG: hypothetical protein II100_03455 [Prevotella sp.]|nr:hypothetical protein [Prevotella sp.]
MKKKFLLFILASLFAITQGAWAGAVETPQVIWCSGNTTLYFINSETLYTANDTYDGQTVTQVWSGTDVTDTPNDYVPGFKFVTNDDCTKVIFDESFASVLPNSCHGWFDAFHKLANIVGI